MNTLNMWFNTISELHECTFCIYISPHHTKIYMQLGRNIAIAFWGSAAAFFFIIAILKTAVCC